LEFYRKNRTKTDWVMHEYRLYGAVPAFSLERGIYRKVFKKDSYEPASWYHADNNGGNPVRYNSELMDMYDTLRDGDKLAQREPWELPRYFIVKNNLSRSSVRTKSGVWNEKEDDLIAVRSPESSSSTTTTTTPPSYVGVKKTFEFSLNDGTKTDWVMREYLQLHHNWSYPAASFVQDNVVLRKVFRKGDTEHHEDSSSRYRSTEKYVEAYEKACSRGELENDTRRLSHLADESTADLCFVYKKVQRLPDCESRSVPEMQTRTTADPDERADNVWEHFTKFCSANDPDEVYAACHRCDKVLKAHPKKHGTSHLIGHIHTCSSCTNPSTDEDREMLHHLRTALDNPYEQQKMMDEKLNCQEDLNQLNPYDLIKLTTGGTPWYITTSFNRQTREGMWVEKNEEFVAIRMEQPQMWHETSAVQMVDLSQKPVTPEYPGVRRTLEFRNQDGRKTDWFMHEYQRIMLQYQQVDDNKSPALLLQGGMVIRKVFRYNKDAFLSTLSELDRFLNGDDNDEEYLNGEGMNTTITNTTSSDYMDNAVNKKRKRTRPKSEVWMYFTQMHNTRDVLVYVVCHSCDKGFTSGRSTNGTSHLWRHHRYCANKRPSTGNANDATTEWETKIRPVFLNLKN